MLRSTPIHGTVWVANDDDDDEIKSISPKNMAPHCPTLYCAVTSIKYSVFKLYYPIWDINSAIRQTMTRIEYVTLESQQHYLHIGLCSCMLDSAVG